MSRRIALVGTAQSSAHAPFRDESWEIWGVGYRGDHVTRATRWYELHRLEGGADGPEWPDLVRAWAKDCELWMMWPQPLGETVHQYPHERMAARFGTFFMTSSFAWMMAQAIDELRPVGGEPVPGEIGLWGVDMEYGTEYREQRAGLRHFISLAKALGIPVRMVLSSGLAYEPVPYPFRDDDPLLAKLRYRKATLAKEKQVRQTALDGATGRLDRIAAAKDELRRGIQSAPEKAVKDWAAERIASLDREADSYAKAIPKLQFDANWCAGALDELDWFQDYLQP